MHESLLFELMREKGVRGLNEAFLVDTSTKEWLVREDSRSAEIIKPYLRGQDIKRWSPEWQGLWMIFARRSINIDAYPTIKRHLQQFRERLEPKPKGWSGGRWPGRKARSYKWYEIQDSVDYWELFEQPKFVLQRIAFHPRIALNNDSMYVNDSAIVLPTSDAWILACLNSPANWYFAFRYLPHKKDEALAMDIVSVEKLPIAQPTAEARAKAEGAVGRLIGITRSDKEARRDLLDWLCVEFGIEKPGQKLENFAALDADAFVEEVRKRRPKGEGRLPPPRCGSCVRATPKWRHPCVRTGKKPRGWRLASPISSTPLTASRRRRWTCSGPPLRPRCPGVRGSEASR